MCEIKIEDLGILDNSFHLSRADAKDGHGNAVR